ncbi:MAG: hypothetical protein R6U63_07920 [Longimicrobiales bacterium]
MYELVTVLDQRRSLGVPLGRVRERGRRVAVADRDYDPSERHLLAEIGARLDMSAAATRAVLAEEPEASDPSSSA